MACGRVLVRTRRVCSAGGGRSRAGSRPSFAFPKLGLVTATGENIQGPRTEGTGIYLHLTIATTRSACTQNKYSGTKSTMVLVDPAVTVMLGRGGLRRSASIHLISSSVGASSVTRLERLSRGPTVSTELQTHPQPSVLAKGAPTRMLWCCCRCDPPQP